MSSPILKQHTYTYLLSTTRHLYLFQNFTFNRSTYENYTRAPWNIYITPSLSSPWLSQSTSTSLEKIMKADAANGVVTNLVLVAPPPPPTPPPPTTTTTPTTTNNSTTTTLLSPPPLQTTATKLLTTVRNVTSLPAPVTGEAIRLGI